VVRLLLNRFNDLVAESWVPDGTQEPPPPPPAPDPLAGLVTGASYAPEPLTFKVAKPSMPDMAEVRKAVDAVLGEEEALATEEERPTRRPATPRTSMLAISPAATTPGMVPPNPRPGWPGAAVVRRLPGVPSGGQRLSPPTRAALQRGRRAPSAGVGGVVVLIIVIIVVLWIVINSLVETIQGIFG
jgi:hypothetical protein